MKNNIIKKGLIVSVLSFALIGFFLLGGISSTTVKAENKTMGEISVGGVGLVMAKPDIGIINIGVETTHKDSKTAQEENAKLTNQVMESLKGLNIKKDDIKTASYNMYRENHYNPQDGKSVQGNFIVSNSIEITVRDIEKVGMVIDTVTKKGANQVNNIRFTVSDTSPYYQEALKLAVKNANEKANTIATAMGIKVGKPAKVIENSYSEPTIFRGMEVNKAEAMDMNFISTGELEIKAQLQVIYNY